MSAQFSVSPSQKYGVEVWGGLICPGRCLELDPGFSRLPPQSLFFKVKPIGAVNADSGGSKNMECEEHNLQHALSSLF